MKKLKDNKWPPKLLRCPRTAIGKANTTKTFVKHKNRVGSTEVTAVCTDRQHGGRKTTCGGNKATRQLADKLTDELVAKTTRLYRKAWPKFEVIGDDHKIWKKEIVECENGKPEKIEISFTLSIRLLRKGRKSMFVAPENFSVPFPSLVGKAIQ